MTTEGSVNCLIPSDLGDSHFAGDPDDEESEEEVEESLAEPETSSSHSSSVSDPRSGGPGAIGDEAPDVIECGHFLNIAEA